MRLRSREYTFASLVLSLVAILVVYPAAESVPIVRHLLVPFLLTSYLVAIRAAARGRWVPWVGAALCLLPLLQVVLFFATGAETHFRGTMSGLIPVNVFTIAVIIRFVFRPGPVTLDKLYAAISVYLLAGLTWGAVYGELLTRSPDAIQLADTSNRWGNLLYFSFVTLTTVGYGDILPLSQTARSLAILEAVFGVVYLATVVARLVGLHTGRGSPDDDGA